MSFSNKMIISTANIRPVVIAISLAFPFASHASTVAADLRAEGYWYDTPVTKSVTATPDPLLENVIFSSPWYNTTSTAQAVSDGAGHFASSVSAQHDLVYDPGSAAATTHLSFVDTIKNTTALSQAVNFGIAINSLTLSLNTGWMGTNQTSFVARVFVDNNATAIWESTAKLDSDWNGQTSFVTGGGTPLAFIGAAPTYLDDQQEYAHSYSLSGPYGTTLNLGNLAAGNSISVRYEVDLFAETYAYGGMASVSFDDPSGLALGGAQGKAISGALSLAQPVPEPETYAMMLAGLALVAGAAGRRRRNQK